MTDIFSFGEQPNGPTPPGSDGPERNKRGKRKRSRGFVIFAAVACTLLGVALVLAIIGGSFAFSLANTYNSKTTQLKKAFPAETTRPTPTKSGAVNILLMGSDSRGDSTTIDNSGPTNQRTDTMLLVHVNADRKNVYVMSIMRDLYVPIPGHGTNKINAAFAYGGSPLTVQTVEQFLGVRIDHVAIIDFQGFKDMSTALGGVDVTNAIPFSSGTYSYPAGVNHLQGAAALAYVRARYPFADGDYQRVKNQQAFIRGVADTLLSRGTLTDPGKITAFVSAMSPYLTVDDKFDAATVAQLGFSLRSLGPSNLHFFTIPTAGTGTVGDQSIVRVDQAAMPGLRDALKNDTLSTFTPAG